MGFPGHTPRRRIRGQGEPASGTPAGRGLARCRTPRRRIPLRNEAARGPHFGRGDLAYGDTPGALDTPVSPRRSMHLWE